MTLMEFSLICNAKMPEQKAVGSLSKTEADELIGMLNNG